MHIRMNNVSQKKVCICTSQDYRLTIRLYLRDGNISNDIDYVTSSKSP